MTEDYLHYIYKHRLFSQENLCTTTGEKVEIIHTGIHNSNAGPDFLEAKLKIDDKLWAGHVELHVRSSDWQRHNHQTDRAYNNVVLHVVYQYDAPALRQSGTELPTLVLQNRFDDMGYWRYEQFVGNQKSLACARLLADVETMHKTAMLERTLVERLEQKSAFVNQVFEQTQSSWSDTFYRLLLYTFGLKVNAEAMLVLAERLPISILRKHIGNVFQLEALLLGTAGLIETTDQFGEKLQQEFDFLQHKYTIHPMAQGHFKFARLRPSSFPTVRLAQLAAILNQNEELFRVATNASNISQLLQWFQQKPSEYWQNHYRFGKESKAIDKTPALGFLQLVIINAVVPTVFAYGNATANDALKQRAVDWLTTIPAEQNNIIQAFADAGLQAIDAHNSQAMLQLHKHYCRPRKCLSCSIGTKILKQL